MSQYPPNYLGAQGSQIPQHQSQQQLQQQHQHQQQQQHFYPPQQQFYYGGNQQQQFPEGSATNVGGYQQYPGAPSSASQPPSQEHHQQVHPHQSQMQRQPSPQSQQYPYNNGVNVGFGGPQHVSHPYPPPHLQHPQHFQPPHQQQFVPPDVKDPQPINKGWIPTEKDLEQLDQWFFKLDAEGRGYIGGAQAVGFLSNSNLSRDTLRIIWSLVDANNTGYIDLHQFYKTIRLVAISCSPMFAGAVPSIEKYYSTAALNIALPLMIKVETASINPAAVLPEPVQVAAPSAAFSGMPVVQQSSQSVWNGGYPPYGATVETPRTAADMPTAPTSRANSMHQNQMLSGSTSNGNLSYYLPEQPADVKVVDEFEFSDFESAQTVEVQSNDVFTFSPVIAVPSVVKIETDMTAIPKDEHDMSEFMGAGSRSKSPDFGDFGTTSYSTTTTVVHHNVPSAPIVADVVVAPPTLGAGANARMSFFDDLIESDLQVGAEEWEDFADCKEEEVAEKIDVEDAVNPFDMFTTDDDVPSNAVAFNKPITDAGDSVFNITESYNDASFIAYEELTISGDTQSTSVISESIFQASESFNFPPVIPSGVAEAAKNDINIDFGAEFEDEDFGDFEEANVAVIVVPPEMPMSAPPTVPLPATLPLLIASDFKAGPVFTSAPPAVPLPIPLPQLLSSDFKSGAIMGGMGGDLKSKDSRFDSMDLLCLDESPPLPPFLKSTSSSAFHAPFIFGGLVGDTASGETTAEIFSPSLSPPVVPLQLSFHSAAHTSNSSSSNLSTYSTGRTEKSSSSGDINTLERLVSTLASKDYYEEAYCCLQKITLLKNIEQLKKEKSAAIDDDDLEAAVEIKKKLAALKASSDGLEDESSWAAAAASHRTGESLDDMVELVQAIDPKKGVRAQQLLQPLKVSGSIPNSELCQVADRLTKALSVKRSLRMATAVSTTHSKHAQYWLLLLNHVSSALQNTSNIMDAFHRLKQSDRDSVLACEKMKVFIAGSLKIAELGVWVSASCVESMVHEALADRVVTQCHIFVEAAAAIWILDTKASPFQFALPTVQSLLKVAAEQAALSQGGKDVVYCYLTLRPIATGPKGLDALEPVIDAVRERHKSSGEYFLKSALTIWTQEISTDLPDSDGSF